MSELGPPRPLEMQEVRALAPAAPGDELVSFAVSPAGEAVTAWASPEDRARLHGRSPRGAPQTLLSPPGATLRVAVDGAQRPESGHPELRELRELRVLRGVLPANPSVHLLPGGETLVVGARAARRGGDPQHNAVVYGAAGEVVRSACLGDGISQVATTASGRIWVGYFDEGVFGNFGWGGVGAEPIGAAGWNGFDASLERVWTHPDPEEGEIADCYALTTSGEDCLVCPYTDWPILRARGGRLQRWRGSVSGASELLVMGHELALVGGYQDERDRVVAGALERERLSLLPGRGQLRICGAPWRARSPLTSRDGVLHTVLDGTWYALELPAIVEALR